MALILHLKGSLLKFSKSAELFNGRIYNKEYSVQVFNDVEPEKLNIILHNFPANKAMQSFIKKVGKPNDLTSHSWTIDIDTVNSEEFVYRWFILLTQSHIDRVYSGLPTSPPSPSSLTPSPHGTLKPSPAQSLTATTVHASPTATPGSVPIKSD